MIQPPMSIVLRVIHPDLNPNTIADGIFLYSTVALVAYAAMCRDVLSSFVFLFWLDKIL